MGAYLSEPILEKHSSDESGKFLCVGASSMQGWRVSQEDAHNAVIDYDPGKSLFAVYDGHGGHEVAKYCSLYLPDFIKKNENYKVGNYEKCLKESFVAFDATLVDRKVVEKLKAIAECDSEKTEEDESKEAKEDEVNDLFQEATMPIEEVIAKYGADQTEVSGEPQKKPVHSALGNLMKDKKPISPFLRAKNGSALNAGEGGSGLNKHIRFDEKGETIKENGDTEEEETVPYGEQEDKEDKGNSSSATGSEAQNGHNGSVEWEESEAKENGLVSNNGEEEESSEKENKDLNGLEKVKNGEANTPAATPDLKGKGKGKGKGKSNLIQAKALITEEEENGEEKREVHEATPDKEKKSRKSATEIYHSLLKASPESGDEDSEDSEDEEFGGDLESDDDDDDDDELEEEAEEDEEDDEDEDEDSDLDDEEDEEEEEEEGCIQADFTEEPGNDSGCTAVVALLAGTTLLVANAGDSRCVVCRDGKAVDMSIDHKPEDALELARIRKAGGKVTPDGRVNGGLNLSRAIGDHAYKQNKKLPLMEQMISPLPDIRTLQIDPITDTWMILACDGIWNFMSSQEVVDYINERINTTPDDKLSSICEELFEHCLAPDTHGDGTGCDNMTAVIVKFKIGFKTVKDVVLPAAHEGQLDATISKGGSSSSAGGEASSSSTAAAGSTAENGGKRPADEVEEEGPEPCNESKKLKLAANEETDPDKE